MILRMSNTAVAHPADRILSPVIASFTREVAERIVAVQIAPDLQCRVDELAAKAADGDLSGEERAEYEGYVDRADLLGVVKSLARQSLAGIGQNG
jgi:hypothetical protein